MSGTWRPLANPPPFAASTMLLLTDGTIMCQQEGGVNWWRLSPDQSGGYVNGRGGVRREAQHPGALW